MEWNFSSKKLPETKGCSPAWIVLKGADRVVIGTFKTPDRKSKEGVWESLHGTEKYHDVYAWIPLVEGQNMPRSPFRKGQILPRCPDGAKHSWESLPIPGGSGSDFVCKQCGQTAADIEVRRDEA